MIKRSYGAHPLMILNIVKPFMFVLVLPVIKGFLQYLLSGKITGVLPLEIAAVVLIFAVAFLSFKAFRITIDDKKVIINKGFFIRTQAVINRDRLSSVTSKRGPFDIIFGSVTYKVNTEAGASGKTDFSFKLRINDAKEVFLYLYGEEDRTTVRFNLLKSAVFAAATSSAITGLVVGVPIINNLGKILGVALSKTLFDEISNASSRFDKYFPPIVNIVTLILILGYVTAIFITFVKMLRFGVSTGKEKIEVKSGITLKRRTVFKKAAINDVCIEQTPIMRLFRMFSMRAAVGGYGDKRGEKAIIVPAASHKEIKSQFEAYFPFLSPDGEQLCAGRSKRNVMRFLWPSRFAAALDIAFTVSLSLIFRPISRFLIFVGITVMLLIVYYGNLCYKCYKSGSLCISENIFASGFSGLTVREIYSTKENVGEIKIIRTPPDIKYGTCKAEIIICSESADKIKVINIDYGETLKMIENCYKMQE